MKLCGQFGISQRLFGGVTLPNNDSVQAKGIGYKAVGVLLNDELELSDAVTPVPPYSAIMVNDVQPRGSLF